jgi:hypothetical protein
LFWISGKLGEALQAEDCKTVREEEKSCKPPHGLVVMVFKDEDQQKIEKRAKDLSKRIMQWYSSPLSKSR